MSKLETRINTPAIAVIAELIGLLFFIGAAMISPAHGRMMVSLIGVFFGIGGVVFFGRIALFNQPVIEANWLDEADGRSANQVLHLGCCSPPVVVSCGRWGSPVEQVARGWPVM